MNNHFAGKAVANAAALRHAVGQPVPGEYSDEMLARYPFLEERRVAAERGDRLFDWTGGAERRRRGDAGTAEDAEPQEG